MDYDLAEIGVRQRRLAQYITDGILTTRLRVDVAICKHANDYGHLKPVFADWYTSNHDVLTAIWEKYEEIEAFARVWEARNWQSYYATRDNRGHSVIITPRTPLVSGAVRAACSSRSNPARRRSR